MSALLTQLCTEQHWADKLATSVIRPEVIGATNPPIEKRSLRHIDAQLQLGKDDSATQPCCLQLME